MPNTTCSGHPTRNREEPEHFLGSPYKSMQVVFYQRVTGMGVTNKYLQVNAALVNPIAIAGVRCVHFFWNLDVPGHVSGNLKLL